MLKSWLRKWLGIEPASPGALTVPERAQEVLPPLKTIVPPSGGFFSSTVNREPRGNSDKDLAEWLGLLGGRAFQRTPADMATVAATVAMDSGDMTVAPAKFAMDSAKDFYSLNGGSPMPAVQISWYAAQSFIGYQMCAILLQHWFIDKACTMPARDAIRNGYDVTRDDGERLPPLLVNEFKKLDKRFKVKANCVEAVRKCKAFGIRIVLFEVTSEDPDYYLKPFNPDGVKPGSYKGMSQVDPYWITPELDFNAAANPASKWFYEPTYWRINGNRYHRSHLVVLKRNEVPDVLKPTYFYGGVPLPQQLYERCYAAERTANEAPQLALTKRTTVIEGVDMAAAMAQPAKFEQRIQEWAYFRDNYGVRVSGGTEKVAQFDTTLTDVDTVISGQYGLACAIAETPQTKMLGTQAKGGIGNQGEYEESSYHESLESIQEHDMEPIIERHHLLCVRSYIMPKFKIPAFDTGVEFAELDSETALEHATRTNMEAERDLKWAQAGAIDGTDIRNRLINDKDSGYSGIEEAEPDGPAPRSVVQPGAPATAPNTPPGDVPSSAPATVAATTPAPSNALDEAVMAVFEALARAA